MRVIAHGTHIRGRVGSHYLGGGFVVGVGRSTIFKLGHILVIGSTVLRDD